MAASLVALERELRAQLPWLFASDFSSLLICMDEECVRRELIHKSRIRTDTLEGSREMVLWRCWKAASSGISFARAAIAEAARGDALPPTLTVQHFDATFDASDYERPGP